MGKTEKETPDKRYKTAQHLKKRWNMTKVLKKIRNSYWILSLKEKFSSVLFILKMIGQKLLKSGQKPRKADRIL